MHVCTGLESARAHIILDVMDAALLPLAQGGTHLLGHDPPLIRGTIDILYIP